MPNRPPRAKRPHPQTRRPSSHAMGYGHAWRKLRNAFIARNPICEDPFGLHEGRIEPATQVDHIIPRRRGGTDDESNFSALCARCHSTKTAKYDGGFSNVVRTG